MTSEPTSSEMTLDPQPTGSDTSTTAEPVTTGVESAGQDPTCDQQPQILYLAFDGETLSTSKRNVDNAPQRIAADPSIAGTYGPYQATDRAQLLGAVRSHFLPFDLCVTDEEPTAPNYDMLVVTSDAFPDAGAKAVAYTKEDCENATNNNVNVLFLSETLGLDPAGRAIAISNTAGRFYGLVSLDPPVPEDLMNPFVGETKSTAVFTDACHPVSNTRCRPTECDSEGQNSFALLTAAFE